MSDRFNLIDTIAKQDKFSTFTKLMASSGANDALSGGGNFTVFVPTNDAFGKLPEVKMNELLNETDQTTLKSLLSYHILPGKVMAAEIAASPTRNAFTGEELTFSDLNGLKVNRASIQDRNIEATNGVIHALDTVLAPPATTPATLAVAAGSTQAAVVPSAPDSTDPSAIPTAAVSSVLSAVPTSPEAATARADIKSIL